MQVGGTRIGVGDLERKTLDGLGESRDGNFQLVGSLKVSHDPVDVREAGRHT